MKDIAIIGAGGFGRETALLIRQINLTKQEWNVIGFFDDHLTGNVDGYPILGRISDLNLWRSSLAVSIAIANPDIKRRIKEGISNTNITFPSLFHPLSQLGDESNTFGDGCIVTSGVVLTINVHLKDFVIINLLSTIGHDVNIGSYSSIMPNVSLSGFVNVGEGCFIGAGARVLQNLNIADRVVVGAGAVVHRNVMEGKTVAGVPASEI